MKKYKVFLLSLLLLVPLILVGCGNSKPDNESVKKVTSNTNTDVDFSGVVIRIGAAEGKNGQAIIEAAGLDKTPYKVEFHVMQGGNLVLEAMAANQIDLGTGSQIPPIFASQSRNEGNLKIIATKKSSTLDQELVVSANSPIKAVKDLKGKKIAYVKSTTSQYFLAKMLENAGLSWGEAETIAMSTSDGLSALLTGEVDALASYGNAIRSAHAKGAVTLQPATGILSGDFYWYATPDAIQDPKKHAAILDYLSRFHEANEWARQHPDKWAAHYAPQINQKTQDYLNQFNEETQQTKTIIVPVDNTTIASEQDIVNTFAKLGLLNSGIDISKIFDHSFDAEISKFKKY
ncbi:Putative aliphatic sulfonates-binding protein [Sporomusa silvacetica DSM 10669]|uniref:Aliphatic sulfonates-binding protein n=1 Tax=Sporomusa silvacetica DSM 10669 TaxID=1123289 RepID=A0ABZ3INM6_9FIRM|nr:ABC transporter substrate-binding protein [Sporomusa silvacetica]OZC14774.1 putative aliphatic sulfonates-binding protein precursor [Sporomusa silvacetica DSM 10669]